MAVRLDLQLKSADGDHLAAYEGTTTLPEGAFDLKVVVRGDDKAADGLAAEAAFRAEPPAEDWQPRLLRLAASVARKAVRAARKDGMRPPRRLRRWRSM